MMRILLVFFAACAFQKRGLAPPKNSLYFPVGVVVPPGSHYAYVTNANFDLRYNAGTLVRVDLDKVEAADPIDHFNEQAIDEAQTQIIGNIGARPALSRDNDRLFIGTRERGILYRVDLDAAGNTSCGDANTPFEVGTTCDADHITRLSGTLFNPDLTLADTADPYVGAVAPPGPGLPGQYLFLTHLTSSAVTVYDITPNSIDNPLGLKPIGLLGSDQFGVGVNGTAAIAVAAGPGRKSVVYAGGSGTSTTTQRKASAVYYFEPRVATGQSGVIGALLLQSLLGGSSATIDVKDMIVSPDGNRLYMITREPDAIVAMDVSLDIDGRPRNTIIRSAPVDKQPGQLVYLDGPRPMLYVSCYQDNTLRSYDALTMAPLSKIQHMRAGPYGLAVAQTSTRSRVLIATYFNDDALLLIDASNDDASEHNVFARVGTPRSQK